MFFKSFIKTLQSSFNESGFDSIDPNIVKFFRIEYGEDWKAALEQHLHKESLDNDKKAA